MNIALECHQVTEPLPGVWCDRCLAWSAIKVGFAVVAASSLHTMVRFEITVCEECDTPDAPDAPGTADPSAP
jgi:hypothetical protein